VLLKKRATPVFPGPPLGRRCRRGPINGGVYFNIGFTLLLRIVFYNNHFSPCQAQKYHKVVKVLF
jgi:hypothetical protein